MSFLDHNRALSRYRSNDDVRLEYQRGKILIWVDFPIAMAESEALRVAGELLPAAWDGIKAAVETAEEASRRAIPDFWQCQDMSRLSGERLAVWSVAIDAATQSVEYFVGRNHDFSYEPDLPEDHGVFVKQGRSGVSVKVVGSN